MNKYIFGVLLLFCSSCFICSTEVSAFRRAKNKAHGKSQTSKKKTQSSTKNKKGKQKDKKQKSSPKGKTSMPPVNILQKTPSEQSQQHSGDVVHFINKPNIRSSQANIANLVDLANDQFSAENYAAAESSLKKALEKDSSNPALHFNLAACYIAQKQYKLAIEHLLHTLELNPAVQEAYFSLAYSYQALNKPREALLAFRQGLGLDLNAKLPRSIFYNEVILSSSEDLDADNTVNQTDNAKPNAKSSLQIPQEAQEETKVNITKIISAADYYTDQIADYKNELSKHPDDVQLQYKLGVLYLKTKQFSEAQAIQKKLTETNQGLASSLKEQIEKMSKP